MRLALASGLTVLLGMKSQKSIHNNTGLRLLSMVPLICSLAFAACSDLGSRPGTSASVNLQSAAVGERQSGDNVTIGPRTYNSESKSFERPWPFGPESNPQ
jgi:hypothetical protein